MAEPTRTDGGPSRPLAQVLTHPAFDRPAVVNPRRRGGQWGAISLLRERQRRELERREAERAALRNRPLPTVDELERLHAARRAAADAKHAAGLCGDDGVIADALARLQARLRQPGEVFDSPQRVRDFLALRLADLDREVFGVMFLDQHHGLIAFEVLHAGTLAQTEVHPREVARRALALNAAALILVHNHPSGKPEPSRADVLLTRTLIAALDLIGVRVVDHCIVGGLQVVSMAERRML